MYFSSCRYSIGEVIDKAYQTLLRALLAHLPQSCGVFRCRQIKTCCCIWYFGRLCPCVVPTGSALDPTAFGDIDQH